MALENTITILRKAPVLGLFEDEALRIIANVADARRLRAGEVLFRQGDRSDGGYVVTAGAIAVAREGDEEEAVLLGPGSVIGEVALFVRMQRPSTATAREPSAVIRISPTLMKRVLQEYPAAAEPIAALLSRDLEGIAADLDRVERLFAETTT